MYKYYMHYSHTLAMTMHIAIVHYDNTQLIYSYIAICIDYIPSVAGYILSLDSQQVCCITLANVQLIISVCLKYYQTLHVQVKYLKLYS